MELLLIHGKFIFVTYDDLLSLGETHSFPLHFFSGPEEHMGQGFNQWGLGSSGHYHFFLIIVWN